MNNAIFLDKLTLEETKDLAIALKAQGYDLTQLQAHNIILQNEDDIEDTLRDEFFDLFRPNLTDKIIHVLVYSEADKWYIQEELKKYSKVFLNKEFFYFKLVHDIEDAGDSEHTVPFCTDCATKNIGKTTSEIL